MSFTTTEIDQKEIVKGVTYLTAAVSMPAMAKLEDRVRFLEAIVTSLTAEMAKIQTQLAKKATFEVEEELPRSSSEIIEAVASYLKEKGEAYPSEIADKLCVSVKEVLAAISILQKEEKVGEV